MVAGLFGAIERSFISVWNPTADPKSLSMLKQLQATLAVLLVYHHLLWDYKDQKKHFRSQNLFLQLQVVYCPKVTKLKSPMLLGGG